MTSLRLAHPVLLALLLGLILAGTLLKLRRQQTGVTFSTASDLLRLAPGTRLKAHLPLILRTTALVLLALAAARPQLADVSRETLSPGVDIILCLDTSGSMQALDFTLDGKPAMRLTAVQKVVSDFIEKRIHDRVGLVVFGEQAFTQAPLTLDKGLLLNLVQSLTIGMAGDATALGDAIAVSAKRLKDLEAPSKILIVLTDGRSNAGALGPAQAAAAAAALGIRIYTIGVGGQGEAPFLVRTPFGNRIFYQEVDLDEETLREVAATGGGAFFLASDTKRLSEIYDLIDAAEKREVKVKEFFHFEELYHLCLIPALLLLALELLLCLSVLRVVP